MWWEGMRDRMVLKYGEDMGTFLAKRLGRAMRGLTHVVDFSVVELEMSNAGVDRIAEYVAQTAAASNYNFRKDGHLHHYKSDRRFLYSFEWIEYE